jgi:hypothetical protein
MAERFLLSARQPVALHFFPLGGSNIAAFDPKLKGPGFPEVSGATPGNGN